MPELPGPAAPLKALIVCPDQKLSLHLEQVCSDVSGVKILKTIGRYPAQQEFVRLIRIYVPQVVFVSVANIAAIKDILLWIKQESVGIQVVAMHHSCDSEVLIELMRLSVSEFLAAPFLPEKIVECLAHVQNGMEANPVSLRGTDLIYSFLPAKPGVGATTIAVHSAMAVSQQKLRVFLGDFDLNCGLIRFNLQLQNSLSVVDAAQAIEHIDEQSWSQLITSVGSLDVMHAGTLSPQTRLEAVQLRQLLQYLRRSYKVVCADLSGGMEKYSLEILHESKQIYLVTTPELPALHLAREKYKFLENLDLGDRVTVLLNRVSKQSPLSMQKIEDLIGRPVMMSFPNDYRSVHEAIAAGTFVRKSSPLSVQCNQLAMKMIEAPKTAAKNEKRRFVQYFSLVPNLYRMQKT